MRNNNGASIRRLSMRSLKSNRMRNLFAVLAIALTGMLFTAVFSLTGGAMQAAEEETMREVGGRSHAGIKAATMEQFEKIASDPSVVKSDYTILLGIADNIIKRQAEIRYTPEEDTLSDMFITLEEGHMPEAADEVIVDTFILDEAGLPYRTGEKITLRFSFMGGTIEDEFTVCGWYKGDAVSHASELFVSESYWTALKGSYTEEDFLRRKEEHPEDAGAGLIAGNLFFEDTRHLEEKVQAVIKNAGYEPEKDLAYGVNWAYMSSRAEMSDLFTLIILCGAVFVILLTGYLITYNIFRISVVSDIRFYGLLKTIGATKKQIGRLVRRQAFYLSVLGIPIGLFAGFGVGRVTLPFLLSMTDSYREVELSSGYNLWILLLGAGFSGFTVWFSSRKPGKTAGSVSPVEAVRYTENSGKKKAARIRQKEKNLCGRGRFDALSMALSNLEKNRRTAFTVIAAMSLSIILLAIVMTAVGSFRLDRYIEDRIMGDFQLQNISIISSAGRSGDLEIAPEYLALADAQDGVEEKLEMWLRFRSFVKPDEEALRRLKALDAQGKLKRGNFQTKSLEEKLQGEKDLDGTFYGYSEEMLANLEVLEGTLDVERFRSGDYILIAQIQGDEMLPAEEHIYHPGDKVTVKRYTEQSSYHEIKDAAGEITDIAYEGLEEREYEVMAVVKIPSSMNIHRYMANAFDVVLPLSEFEAGDEMAHPFGVCYRVAEDAQEDFEAALQAYTAENPQMGYMSKDSLGGEFRHMISVMAAVGITLAAVIALIGIMNFSNAMITEIISRKREFAVLQSIGMTNGQLQKTLIFEGISYIAVSGAVSFVLGSLLSWIILRALNNLLMFFEYRFQILPFVIMIPVLMLAAVLVPLAAWKNVRKKSIIERLRENG